MKKSQQGPKDIFFRPVPTRDRGHSCRVGTVVPSLKGHNSSLFYIFHILAIISFTDSKLGDSSCIGKLTQGPTTLMKTLSINNVNSVDKNTFEITTFAYVVTIHIKWCLSKCIRILITCNSF